MKENSEAVKPETVLIVDFGGQLTQLIARRVRETGVYSEIVPFFAAAEAITKFQPKAIILSGGPNSVTEASSPRAPQEVFDAGVPVLGICYGQQTMVAQLGGAVEPSNDREYGDARIRIIEPGVLFDGVGEVGATEAVWMSHGDRVMSLPLGFHTLAVSEHAPFAAIADDERRLYGVQFHPEAAHTPRGAAMLGNFLRLAGFHGEWSMRAFKQTAIDKIREQVGKGRVILGLSGGVDSSVAAVLIHEAIGDQLTCIFVDHGLMREGEGEQVVSVFRGAYNIPLVHVRAEDKFISALAGVADPETKRKIIGGLFIEVFDEEASKLGGADFLAQGTVYPDVIESVSATGGPSATIKSHHNVGGLPERMKLKLLEPLRELFKDEVRALGRELGLPEAFIERHPFPGPGLAIRILSDVTPEKLAILQCADAIFIDEIRKAGLYNEIWQAFAVLLPVRTVGVMGDARTYDYVCGLRAVTSSDGMTAQAYAFTADFLTRASSRITNEVKGINRIVYDVTSKPPGTIEWE
ncbi:MAG: glutamine-hydrolyzing GMP synthase [Hyphomicrobiales bacterium]|nr:glutamine-hydrolyzing GMP synthase [Hyphomicrobiales bacterium]